MASVGSQARTNGDGAVAEIRRLQAVNERLARELEASMRELSESRTRIMSVAVRERQRIERDLHDGAQQRLVAAQVRIGLARGLLAGDPQRGEELLQSVDADLQEALEELRLLAHGVYPAVLSEKGIGPALREAARHSPLDVQVDPDGIDRYPSEVESAVYFCCLEALQNAAKHAGGATRAWITMASGAELSFEVRDDGAGFSPHTTAPGAGLTNMRDRLAAVNGGLELFSSSRSGTRVVGTIPLQAGD